MTGETDLAAWITLTVHAALEAVGLTAAFSTALTKNLISCNIMAGYCRERTFVATANAGKAMEVLRGLSAGHRGISGASKNYRI